MTEQNKLAVMVDPEFHALIPPLTDEEKDLLRTGLIQEGCRDSLITWQGKLLDGHNRLEICQENNIPYITHEIENIHNRDGARLWIIQNQLGRRNLTPDQASILRGQKYNLLKGKRGGDQKSKGQNDTLNAAELLGKEQRVSSSTIKRDGQVAKYLDERPEERQAVLRGEKKLTDVRQEIRCMAEEKTQPKAHVAYNTGDNEWYTPKEYVEAARIVLGTIDLDPASTKEANTVIRATRFYTIKDDGLKQEWHGNIWMNPPYAAELIIKFSEKICAEYAAGNIIQACVLVNNATETRWFQALAKSANAIVFPLGRIRFWHPSKTEKAAPLQGQAILYFGVRTERFIAQFSEFGQVFIHA